MKALSFTTCPLCLVILMAMLMFMSLGNQSSVQLESFDGSGATIPTSRGGVLGPSLGRNTTVPATATASSAKSDCSGRNRDLNLQAKYVFIHPTKTGGTSLENYFCKHFREQIGGGQHSVVCKDFQNPIVILRDPMDRFESIFRYWKYGAGDGIFQRDQKFKRRIANVTADHFASMLLNKERFKDVLYYTFTLQEHFYEQSHWIQPADYQKTIVIRYSDDLNPAVQAMLRYLNLTSTSGSNPPLPHENVSVKEKTELSEKSVEKVKKTLFLHDYELLEVVDNHPELFRKVF